MLLRIFFEKSISVPACFLIILAPDSCILFSRLHSILLMISSRLLSYQSKKIVEMGSRTKMHDIVLQHGFKRLFGRFQVLEAQVT